MRFFTKSRLFFLIVKELSHKYTKALFLGFVSGLLLTIGFWRIFPFVKQQWLTPTTHIGIVGEFTPATIPLSIQSYISSGLTKIGDDGTVLPDLATSWTSTDSGKTFVFRLRPDVVWHNGKPVKTEDINYNIRNVSFSAIDQSTLRASLLAPYSPFPSVVAKPIILEGLVGFGPYRVTNIKLKADRVIFMKLVPVENVSLSAREYTFYKTEAAAVIAFKRGEIDVIEDISDPGDLVNWGKVIVEEKTNFNRIISLYFNLKAGDLADKGFRQALAWASPVREGLERAYSPIAKTSWAYSDRVKKYTFDQNIAKKLLGTTKEATGSAQLTISTFTPYLDDAQAIADSWSALGIATKVKVENSVPPDYQVLLTGQDLPPDPDQYPFWHSTQTVTNITGYVNVKIDKLLEDGRQEIDMQKRKSIYADFQRRIVEDAPVVFLYYPKTYTIKRR